MGDRHLKFHEGRDKLGVWGLDPGFHPEPVKRHWPRHGEVGGVGAAAVPICGREDPNVRLAVVVVGFGRGDELVVPAS